MFTHGKALPSPNKLSAGSEKQARGKSPEERVALRLEHAKQPFDDLETWLHAQLPKISGKSPLAQAIRYALGRLPKARPYLENGCLELDNNTAERAMKPVAPSRACKHALPGSDWTEKLDVCWLRRRWKSHGHRLHFD